MPRSIRDGHSCLTSFLYFVAVVTAATTSIEARDLPGVVLPGKDWEEATPQSQGIDPAKLQTAVDFLEANAPRDGVKELVIVRNGRLIHGGPDIDKVHGVWSATKSFTSTVLGLLIHDGKCTLDTLAKVHLPEMSENFAAVTLRHFTTMTSGYRAVFGHLMLNRGNWMGRQLTPAEWIEQATKVQVPAVLPLGHPESDIPGPGTYGFNWWVNGINPDGARKWPGVSPRVYAASGHNNNVMFVIPDWNMVIVRFGLDASGEGGFKITDETHAAFLRMIGDAILPADRRDTDGR